MSNLAPFIEPGEVFAVQSGAWFASGIVINTSGQSSLISGQNVVVSSGAISVVSGSITINSGQIAVSGLYQAGLAIQSGMGGVSGMLPVALMVYDASGVNWGYAAGVISGGTGLGTRSFPSSKIRIGLSGIGFEASASGAAVNSGIPSLSGGVLLSSGDTNMVILRNNPGNNFMYVGSTTERPASGFGFKLAGGDGLTLPVTNFNLIAVFAATSGQYISYIGTQY